MKYSTEEIEEAVGKALRDPQKTIPLYDYIIAELTKPKWKPAVGQMMVGGNGCVYTFSSIDDIHGWRCTEVGGDECIGSSSELRPLTTKEAGPECMQHLVDALEKLTPKCGNTISGRALAKHKDLLA